MISCRKHNITVYNCTYIHTNITTCFVTQCPILLFFLIVLIYFSKFYCLVISRFQWLISAEG